MDQMKLIMDHMLEGVSSTRAFGNEQSEKGKEYRRPPNDII